MVRFDVLKTIRPASDRHIPALDGLRGVAILLVVVYHFTNLQPSTTLQSICSHVATAGWMGVDLFFVLSGFLITGILDDAKGAPHYFRSFFARRTLRIFPLYYAVLALVTFGFPLVTFGFRAMGLRAPELRAPEHAGYLFGYATNFVIAFRGRWVFDSGSLPLSHFWSLAVEEHFYLIWPFLIGFLRRRSAMLVCAGCIVAAPLIRLGFYLAGYSPLGPYVFTLCRMDTLATGGLIALALRSPSGAMLLARRRAVLGLLVGAGVGVGAMFAVSHSTHWHRGPVQLAGYSFGAAFFGCLVLLIATAPRAGALAVYLSLPWLRAVGKYSYGMYVWHALLGTLIMKTAPRLLHSGILRSALLAQWIQLLVGFTVSFASAYLSFHLFEKHFLKLKRFFEYRPVQAEMHAAEEVPSVPRPALHQPVVEGRVAVPPK